MMQEWVYSDDMFNKKTPEKFRTVFIKQETKEIFICGEMFRHWKVVYLCCVSDSVSVISKKRSVFIPIEWAKKEYKKPIEQELLSAIEKKVKSHIESLEKNNDFVMAEKK